MSKDATPCRPPKALKKAQRLTAHGVTRSDDYFWLNDRDDPRVLSYLRAENDYTEAVLGPWRELRQTLLDEMAARIVPDESSVPYRDGDYEYYRRYEEGREYPIYCRRLAASGAAEEVLLDANLLAEAHDYFSLRSFTPAPDHRLAAFAVDTQGRRFYTIHFLDLGTGELLDEQIRDVTSGFEWFNDSSTLVYVRQHRSSLRDYQVLRHTLGGVRDDLLYEEGDEAYWVGVEKSLSDRTLFIVSAATDSTEVRTLDADSPSSQPVLFLARQEEHEYYVTDGADCYVVLSNTHGENFSVFETPIDRTEREAWTEMLPPRETVLLTGLDVFASHIVVSSVENGLDQIEIIDRRSRERRKISVPDAVCSAYTHDNCRYRSPQLRFSYESLVTPESTYDVDMATGEKVLLRRAAVAGDFDASQYATERILVPARDGKQIPVSLAYKKDRRKDCAAPLLLHAYGAYGISSDPAFDSDLISLLDRGFIYGIAHVRGGSECGRAWYYDGRQFAKQNTFNDFIDVTRYLIECDYTQADRCYASGGSAGGLLMGAVANEAPELYHGIVAHVPFVDVLTTMLDETIPLTTGEYAEWGDPKQESAYRYMASYSPYDNVAAQDYPHMLVTAGLHDSQVQYWEPAKWVARLRADATSTGTLLLHTDMGAGHSGKTGRYKALEDTALEFTFLLMLEAQRPRDAATV